MAVILEETRQRPCCDICKNNHGGEGGMRATSVLNAIPTTEPKAPM